MHSSLTQSPRTNIIFILITPSIQGIWEKFSESYCFVENTYFVPMNASLPSSPIVRQNKEMIYYQVKSALCAKGHLHFIVQIVGRSNRPSIEGLQIIKILSCDWNLSHFWKFLVKWREKDYVLNHRYAYANNLHSVGAVRPVRNGSILLFSSRRLEDSLHQQWYGSDTIPLKCLIDPALYQIFEIFFEAKSIYRKVGGA